MHVSSLLFQLFIPRRTTFLRATPAHTTTKKKTSNLVYKSIYSGDEYCFTKLYHQLIRNRAKYYFAIMLLCSIDFGVGTIVNPLFVLKSITILDSPKCLYIVAYKIAIFVFSDISACILFWLSILSDISQWFTQFCVDFVSPSKGFC